MKKISLKFQLPNPTIFLLALCVAFLMTSCQKESLEEMAPSSATTEKYSPETDAAEMIPTDAEVVELQIDLPEEGSAQSRSATSIVFHKTFTVNRGRWLELYYSKNSLPDPAVWKVEVVVEPVYGNPDLYLFGYDVGSSHPYRPVRDSRTNSTERASFRKTGIKYEEERMHMGTYAQTNTKFKLSIYFTTVSCQEYPAADGIVTLEYAPVCGCDGKEYGNPSTAFVNGITSWTEGPCNSVGGNWVNVDGNTRGITKMSITQNGNTIHLFGSCSPTDCDWGKTSLFYDGKCYQAEYDHGFATRYIKLHKQPDGRIKMEMLNDYHDKRVDRTDIYYFRSL
ncbi:MAG: hypothetical protein AAF960_26510 [Bacteroidota bacterium]